MSSTRSFSDLIRLILIDPVAGGQFLIAMVPPRLARWQLMAAAVAVTALALYALPLAMGSIGALPRPASFAGTQFGMNLLFALLATRIGRAFGGQGGFDDALWLVGWMQVITALMLIVQGLVLLVLPALNVALTMASVGVSIWVLVGFLCALHGFQSRLAVLSGLVVVIVALSMVLSVVLVLLGFDPEALANV